MTLADDVTLDDLIMAKDDLSGADIKAICTEAGLMALRERRMKVTNEDFKSRRKMFFIKAGGHPRGALSLVGQSCLPGRLGGPWLLEG